MVPFNGWMPLNYSMASIPVAAVLSGAGVKAGVIGLIRFLPEGASLEGAGVTLAVLGCVSAFFGVSVGLTQKNPKTILAYSSISQMGVICAALGLAMRDGAFASSNIAFYGLNHLLVKATLFLSVGVLAARRAPLGGLTLAMMAALALSLAGLPFTGGALAKLSVKPYLDGVWASALTTASSIGSAWLMTHFLMRLKNTTDEYAGETPAAIVTYWPVIALGAILLPWLFYPAAGDVSKALEAAELWSALWPVAVGAGLALAQQRFKNQLPHIPPGDSIILYEKLFERVSALGPAMENLDTRLRRWQVTGVSFVLITLALLGAAISG
jgi:formate hydrogenlyase subunit 3/multisubunit Na+/H+ antiporter MnhD subunit